jgi:hypothetical protein
MQTKWGKKKDVFYNKLEENYDVAHKYDVTLGDMNAKV